MGVTFFIRALVFQPDLDRAILQGSGISPIMAIALGQNVDFFDTLLAAANDEGRLALVARVQDAHHGALVGQKGIRPINQQRPRLWSMVR